MVFQPKAENFGFRPSQTGFAPPKTKSWRGPCIRITHLPTNQSFPSVASDIFSNSFWKLDAVKPQPVHRNPIGGLPSIFSKGVLGVAPWLLFRGATSSRFHLSGVNCLRNGWLQVSAQLRRHVKIRWDVVFGGCAQTFSPSTPNCSPSLPGYFLCSS